MTLNTEQFGEQLAMFERTSDVIDNVHKGDVGNALRDATPREQWEKKTAHPGAFLKSSLKQRKLSDLKHVPEYKGAKPETMSPLFVRHDPDTGQKILDDGHHRLAFAEKHKMPWVPVAHWGYR